MVHGGTSNDSDGRDPLTAALDTLPIAILFVDHTYTIRWINRKGGSLFGRSQAGLVGQSIQPVDGGLWTWSHGPGLNEIITSCLGPGVPASGRVQDVTILADSGPRQHHIAVTASPLCFSDERITLLTLQDRTPPRRDKQTETFRLAIETARRTAHELNQPLSVLVGNIELLMKQLDANSPVRTRINKISESADRLTETVHRLQMIIHMAKEPTLLKACPVDFRKQSMGA